MRYSLTKFVAAALTCMAVLGPTLPTRWMRRLSTGATLPCGWFCSSTVVRLSRYCPSWVACPRINGKPSRVPLYGSRGA